MWNKKNFNKGQGQNPFEGQGQSQNYNNYRRNYNNYQNYQRNQYNQNNSFNKNNTYQANYQKGGYNMRGQGQNYQRSQGQGYQRNYQNQNYQQQNQPQLNIRNLNQIDTIRIPVLNNTIFDVFGGLEQSFIGLIGEAGSGKSQTLMRLVADISRQNIPVLVVLTEQSPQRWKAMFSKYIETNMANPNMINVIYKSNIDESFINQLKYVEEPVIVIDSFSGGVLEQNARRVAHKLRNLAEFNNKWVITSLQVRKDGQTAGGEGVEHNIEISYRIRSFTLKHQQYIYRKLLEPYGFEVGDDVRLIKEEFNKIRGVLQRDPVIINITPNNPILEFNVFSKRDFEEAKKEIEKEQNQNNNQPQENIQGVNNIEEIENNNQ